MIITLPMITPTKGNVYVRRVKEEEKKTATGIIIQTETFADQANHDRVMIYGEVLAVGDDVKDYKIGEIVSFPRYEAWPLEAKTSREDDEFIVAEKFIYARLST